VTSVYPGSCVLAVASEFSHISLLLLLLICEETFQMFLWPNFLFGFLPHRLFVSPLRVIFIQFFPPILSPSPLTPVPFYLSLSFLSSCQFLSIDHCLSRPLYLSLSHIISCQFLSQFLFVIFLYRFLSPMLFLSPLVMLVPFSPSLFRLLKPPAFPHLFLIFACLFFSVISFSSSQASY
jgi:hypothetical protein